MQIKRIKIKDFLLMNVLEASDYIIAIKYSEEFNTPEDFFKLGDIGEYPFGLIKDFIEELKNGTFNLQTQLEYLKRFRENFDWEEQYLDLICKELTYLVYEIQEIIINENEMLSSKSSFEEQQADISRFNDIGVYMQIRELANNDVTKIEDVRKVPYNTCLLELYTRKMLNEFESDLRKIYTRK